MMKALWQVTIRKKLQRIKRKHLDESDTEKINLIEEGKKWVSMKLLNAMKLLIII